MLSDNVVSATVISLDGANVFHLNERVSTPQLRLYWNALRGGSGGNTMFPGVITEITYQATFVPTTNVVAVNVHDFYGTPDRVSNLLRKWSRFGPYVDNLNLSCEVFLFLRPNGGCQPRFLCTFIGSTEEYRRDGIHDIISEFLFSVYGSDKYLFMETIERSFLNDTIDLAGVESIEELVSGRHGFNTVEDHSSEYVRNAWKARSLIGYSDRIDSSDFWDEIAQSSVNNSLVSHPLSFSYMEKNQDLTIEMLRLSYCLVNSSLQTTQEVKYFHLTLDLRLTWHFHMRNG